MTTTTTTITKLEPDSGGPQGCSEKEGMRRSLVIRRMTGGKWISKGDGRATDE
jgi:hypothetical protein